MDWRRVGGIESGKGIDIRDSAGRPAEVAREAASTVEEQLAYLKSVVEGADDIEPWRVWFDRNAEILAKGLPRSPYLRLKLWRIEAIPEILRSFGIAFNPSDRYAWLAGKTPGRCRDCGAKIMVACGGQAVWCPEGCFQAFRRLYPPHHT